MPRYIDAEKFYEALSLCVTEIEIKLDAETDSSKVLKAVQNGLINFPTADVEPVVHAHWERLDKPKCKRDWYRCTNCGRVRSRDYDDEQSISEMLPYCNCGARMGEEVRKVGTL